MDDLVPEPMPPIAGVPTSVSAFVGETLRGPVNQARGISSFAAFEREFGGLAQNRPVSHAVFQFFRNGGARALVVRIARADGAAPTPAEFLGDPSAKTGLHALGDADVFNFLCLPDSDNPAVLSEALAFCRARRAFLIVDLPESIVTPAGAQAWLAANPLLRSRDAAAWFPRVRAKDPGTGAPGVFATSGSAAGIYARNDASRGVWTTPAGEHAAILDATGPVVSLRNADTQALQSQGLNALRSLPSGATVLWGARTLGGADAPNDEYKYVPVRRLTLFLEESIFRGTAWAVFEPNDEPLWANVRASVGAFLHGLFVAGAFQGSTPREAWFVKCGRETMTRDDIDNGRLIIEIGIAPVKPAEFVIFRIGQFGCGGKDC